LTDLFFIYTAEHLIENAFLHPAVVEIASVTTVNLKKPRFYDTIIIFKFRVLFMLSAFTTFSCTPERGKGGSLQCKRGEICPG
jgi:hypothetical protein